MAATWKKICFEEDAMLKSVLTERGSIIFRDASAPAELKHGTDGQVLTTKGDGADPIWAAGAAGSVATDAIWDEQGDIAYGTGANTAAVLTHGDAGQVLQSGGHGANPSWAMNPMIWAIVFGG
jgi:hypothetical protein